jgi:hypothetical protein
MTSLFMSSLTIVAGEKVTVADLTLIKMPAFGPLVGDIERNRRIPGHDEG